MKEDKINYASTAHYAFLLTWPFEAIGGVNGVLKSLLREFHPVGTMEPMTIELSSRPEGALRFSEGQWWPSISTRQIPGWNRDSPWRSLLGFCIKAPSALWKLRAICRRYSIRVLNPHFISMEYFALVLLRKLTLFRGQLILSFHGADIREMIQSRGLQRRLFKLLLRGSDFLVACSEGLREEILEFVPECASRTVTIHNGIDVDSFQALSSASVTLPDRLLGRRIILNIGAFEYKKGHDILLRAYQRLKPDHSEALLVIVGQCSSKAIEKLGFELGIQDDLLLVENISHEEVVTWLKRADVFVLSSRWEKGVCGEGFAMALLEASAVKIPIVTTLTCGAAELIEDGFTGRIVPTENPDALAAAISEVLSDPTGAALMAERLHKRVIEHFTWKQALEKYRRLACGQTFQNEESAD